MAWIYFMATNYNNYAAIAAQNINSPDFQVQLYKVLLQSLTFFLLIFILGQSAVYILAMKNFRAAFMYLKFFSVAGFAAFFFVTFTNSIFGVLPMAIYLFGYYVFSKLFKEASASLQKQNLSPTLQ